MKTDEKTETLLEWYESIKTERKSGWDSAYRELSKLIRPNAKDFTSETQSGNERNNYIYDSTAPLAADKFAATLDSSITPATERWCKIEVDDDPELNQDPEVKAWTEHVTDRILRQYALPQSNHSQARHEWYLDLGVFCTANLLQEWSPTKQCLTFRSIPLAQTYILENSEGMVDTVFCDYDFTKRQAIQRFGEENLPKPIRESKDRNTKFKFAHAVFPRADDERTRWGNAKGMPFASCWLYVDGKTIVSESGYLSLPYHVVRWEKVAGETYGRGPGHTAIPTIKMVNEEAKVGLMSVQLAMAPPMQVPSDSFMSALDLSPFAINFREPGTEEAKPLNSGARPDVGERSIESLQDMISKAFYTDLAELRWKNERQSATEIIERRNDMLRQQTPMTGRVQSEGIGPMIQRSYELLARNGKLNAPPRSLHRKTLRVNYVSPAAVAQRGSKVNAMNDFINSKLLPLSQIDPGVIDCIDTDRVAQVTADLLNITSEILRTPEQIQAIRKSKQQQQQMATMLAGAQQGAAALKDIAAAGKDTPELLGLPRA